jgi:hypothetical protein
VKRKIGKQSRLFVSYSIFDFKGDPNNITALLKQSPTEIQVRGEPIAGGRAKAKSNAWSYTVSLDSYSLEVHLKYLLKKLVGYLWLVDPLVNINLILISF